MHFQLSQENSQHPIFTCEKLFFVWSTLDYS